MTIPVTLPLKANGQGQDLVTGEFKSLPTLMTSEEILLKYLPRERLFSSATFSLLRYKINVLFSVNSIFIEFFPTKTGRDEVSVFSFTPSFKIYFSQHPGERIIIASFHLPRTWYTKYRFLGMLIFKGIRFL
jgi:hypothetical protein